MIANDHRSMFSARGVDRRTLLRGAGLAGLGGLALAGCGTGVATGIAGQGPAKDTLTYWNLFSGGDGVRMVAMEKDYQKSHPNITLNSVTLSWGNPYYTKLALATLSGRPPDIGISHLDRMPTLAQAGLLTPYDESDLARHGMTAKEFTAKAWDKAHLNGKLYAVPLDTHPFVLYYRTDVCKKAGLLNSDGSLKPIRGPEEFTAALVAAKKVTGAYGGVVNINADPATCWRWFQTLYSQLGGTVLANNGTTITLDEDKAVKVMTFMHDLTIKQKLMPSNIDGGGVTQLFSTGKVGFLLDGEWDITTYQTAGTPFSMVPIPNIFGGPYSCYADSHTFVLPKDPQRDAARLDTTLAFIRTLLNNSMTWAKGGHIPAWLPVQKSKAYKDLKPQSQYASAAEAAVYDPPAWYSGAGSDFENVTGAAIAGVESGQMTPVQGVANMRSGLEKYAKINPPPVA